MRRLVIMERDLRDFWQRFQTGIRVAVGSDLPDKLLGVRDGFVRYFHHGLHRPIPVSVLPQPDDETEALPPLSDAEVLELARTRAARLEERLGAGGPASRRPDSAFAFYVGSETGLVTREDPAPRGTADDDSDEPRYFVRTWTVVRGLEDEAWGSSGSVQLPRHLIRGLDSEDLPFAIPGRRRSGGMVSSLTGGLETRRSATAQATLHAVASIMYGLIESRAGSRLDRPRSYFDRRV